MRALIAAVGTRGDVQPALALAIELRDLGHTVRLCISPNFVDWAKSLGFEAVPMGVEMRMPPSKSGGTPTLTPEELRRLRESVPDLITDQFETIRAAAEGCDVIVGANAHQYGGPSIAERAGIGFVTAVYAPVSLPSPSLAPPPPPGQAVDASGSTSIEEQRRNTVQVWNDRALETVNRNRDRLGLAPIDDVLDYVLTRRTWLATDPVLGPAPETPGREIFQTGTWVFADRRPLPEDLDAFLQRGEPPIFVGFGSMPAAGALAHRLIDAARAVGRRILVSRGWADLEVNDAPDCMAVGDVSHDILFPRVAAVLHHGGAGATATAARAGVPQVITPMFGDQFYWASRIVALGIGATTSHAAMTEESLPHVLRDVLDPAVTHRARALASQVGGDGAALSSRAAAALASVWRTRSARSTAACSCARRDAAAGSGELAGTSAASPVTRFTALANSSASPACESTRSRGLSRNASSVWRASASDDVMTIAGAVRSWRRRCSTKDPHAAVPRRI
jgi:vancomycin aglycone glucosyltransferase